MSTKLDKSFVSSATAEIQQKTLFGEILNNIGKQDLDPNWFTQACMEGVGGPTGMVSLIQSLLASDKDSIRVRVLQILARNAEKQADRAFEARMEVSKAVMDQEIWKDRFAQMVKKTMRAELEPTEEEDPTAIPASGEEEDIG